MQDDGVCVAAEGVARAYGRVQALRASDLAVRRGEVIAVIGPNGAGKTTLLRLLAGSIFPTEGTVRVFGLDRWRESFAIRQRSCFIEAAGVPPVGATPFGHLRFLAQAYGLARDEFESRLRRLAAEMEYTEHLGKSWASLSLGLGKKAHLIGAFLVPAELRILDEPFAGGIDPLGMERLFEWIDAARTRGEATIFSTQVLDQADRVADKLLVIARGRICHFSPPDDLIRRAGQDPNDPQSLAKSFFALVE